MNNFGRHILSDEVLKQCYVRILHQATLCRLLRVEKAHARNNLSLIKNTTHLAHLHKGHPLLNIHLTTNFFHSVDWDWLNTNR